MSRSDEAVESIQTMIAQNGWPGGFQLPSQRTLAEELGFSRPTVREALVALETMGRVEIKPGKGAFLVDGASLGTPLGTPRAVANHSALSGRESQMYQFRYAIEPAIAGLVAVNATAAQKHDMGVVVAAMRTALESRDLTEFSRLDFAFHSHMIEAANNRFFTEAITPFLGIFFESQTLPLVLDDSVHDTVREHEEIMGHIRAGRSAQAHRAMEKHVRGVAERAGVKLVE
ncbi:HTH-type transcriptional regulator LutR [Pseudodesulfovibrio hydrargyri]|uniref:HTH-type transcriptional regulator LutR n=1 Tax=Pseudodesulfovibrio hydrargyri TaxID=2125990 RepID=A0A1J5MXE1_9BACT|nr:FadR/GntR family transcriptional regulator [Pseudodesulfovibrio hydrargyri]OIQ50618.1 HTH-type transcriptional regulator LutR [Pseudodesulfovibrio hydrargyri]